MTLLLTDPVDSLCPRRLRLDSEKPFRRVEQLAGVWRSPVGNFCVGVNQMDECGATTFTIFAFRTAEVLP